MKYARLNEENVVLEIYIPPEGFTINECFHPLIAEQFIQVPDNVDIHWTKDGESWVEPDPLPDPEPPVEETPTE